MCAHKKDFSKVAEFGQLAIMSSSAPKQATGQEPGLQIELRETGGVSGVERTFALKGNTLQVIDKGRISLERHVPTTVVRSFADQVKALESIGPRRSYGRYNYNSDIITTQLEIVDDSEALEMQVISDPRDPAPNQFWEIVNGLRKLSRIDLPTASDF